MVIVRRFIVLLVILLFGTGSVFAFEFQISTSGNTVVVTISGVDPVSCCSGATLDDPTFAGAHCGADGAFSPAFVEYVALPQQITDIPYVPAIRSALELANKWFEHSPTSVTGTRRGDPNVKHVLAGSGQADVRGITRRTRWTTAAIARK
jgi:hypothetical protein